ncbi:MAG: hypothetical protein JNM65_06690 [Verrucomicrobiaceae bacterium]|nr:hypothetical protein [Verrucomicrobiaceae bacterium]
MNPQDNTTANSQPTRSNATRWVIIALIPIVAILAVKLLRPAEWRPDLHLTNTGKSPVTVLYHDQTGTIQPGETWRRRVRAGETISVRPGTAADAPSAALAMPARNPTSDNSISQRWSADVNADDPKNIRFENRLYAEVTEPPTQPKPWP